MSTRSHSRCDRSQTGNQEGDRTRSSRVSKVADQCTSTNKPHRMARGPGPRRRTHSVPWTRVAGEPGEGGTKSTTDKSNRPREDGEGGAGKG